MPFSRIPSHNWRRLLIPGLGVGVLVAGLTTVLLTRARTPGWRQNVVYTPAAELEAEWGRLVAAANITMHSRRAGSDRIGFFDGGNGTVWGLPLANPDRGGRVLGCAPSELRAARVTDSLPADAAEILGASDFFSDAPTGASGVHLLVRAAGGSVRWHRVSASEFVSASGTTCREPAASGRHRDPLPRYHYFRIVTASAR